MLRLSGLGSHSGGDGLSAGCGRGTIQVYSILPFRFRGAFINWRSGKAPAGAADLSRSVAHSLRTNNSALKAARLCCCRIFWALYGFRRYSGHPAAYETTFPSTDGVGALKATLSVLLQPAMILK
jgi:hypothetical protein